MEKVSEKRRFPRVSTHVPLKYRKLGTTENDPKYSTVSRNLSEGGVRFLSPEFVSRACRLILELDMPMFTKPIKAITKVAWIRKTPAGDNYEIGNQFLEIAKKDRELLSQYVNSVMLYNEPEETYIKSEQNSDIDEK